MPNTTKMTLKDVVTRIKLIARDVLRMELISRRLSKINRFENDIKETEKSIKYIEDNISIEKYEISKLDTSHPKYEDKKLDKENKNINMLKDIELLNTNIETNKTLIKEQFEGIDKIEKGETLVSSEKLAEMVEKFIIEEGKKQIKG